MLSMLRTLRDRSDPRHHHLLIGARFVEELMLRPEIDNLRESLDLAVTEIIESPPSDWGGESGRINSDVLERCVLAPSLSAPRLLPLRPHPDGRRGWTAAARPGHPSAADSHGEVRGHLTGVLSQ